MKFSVSLPHPSDHARPEQIDDLIAVASAVEHAGLDAVSVTDHPFPLIVDGQPGHQALDPFITLGYLAAATDRIAMHFSLLVLPYRNPFIVARMLSTLDLLSRGRVIAGIGAGYMRAEFEALAADFENRGAQVVAGVEAMRAAWTGEPVTMSAAGWKIRGNTMRPPPLTCPHPILWRGGNSTTAMQQAAASFDGWAPFEIDGDRSRQTSTTALTLETLPRRLSLFAEAVERAQRTKSVDICYVRANHAWLGDPATVVEQLQTLDDLGVNWLEVRLPGRSRSQLTEEIAAFAANARAARVA